MWYFPVRTTMSPRGILKSPSVFPLEHELPGHEGDIISCTLSITWPTHTHLESRRARSRSRSRDHLRADETLQLTPNTHHRERHGGSQSSRRSAHSRRHSKSRSRRHVKWSDPVAFVVSDGTGRQYVIYCSQPPLFTRFHALKLRCGQPNLPFWPTSC